jgi:tRNA (guanine-N7-)-methyltransferase
MLGLALAEPAFAWTAERAADWRSRPAGVPCTRYEGKALHGRPTWLVLRRRQRGGDERAWEAYLPRS